MDTTTLDFNTLTLLVAIMGSTLTIVSLMLRQFNQLDTKIGNLDTGVAGLENTVTALDTKGDALNGKGDALNGKVDALDAKFDRMGRDVSDARERLARIEGHLMAPEGFRMRGVHPPAPDQPSTENPNPDHRQAG